MQNGGCAGENTCALGPFGGSLFQYLAANVFFAGTNRTIFPPYEVDKVGNAKIAFIGLTLEGTPLVVTPTAVAGLEFRPEVPTVNALVQKLRNEQGVRTFVVLLHQGGIQNAPFSNAGQFGALFPNGFADVNKCDNLAGDITPIVQGLDPQVDVVVSAHTHQPYVCPNYAGTKILLTSASSFGRLVTEHRPDDRPPVEGRHGEVRDQLRRQADRGSLQLRRRLDEPARRPAAQDPVVAGIVAKWAAKSAPLANQVIGHITGDLLGARTAVRRLQRRRRAADRRVDRRRPARGDRGDRLRRRADRVHEPGRDPRLVPLRPGGWIPLSSAMLTTLPRAARSAGAAPCVQKKAARRLRSKIASQSSGVVSSSVSLRMIAAELTSTSRLPISATTRRGSSMAADGSVRSAGKHAARPPPLPLHDAARRRPPTKRGGGWPGPCRERPAPAQRPAPGGGRRP